MDPVDADRTYGIKSDNQSLQILAILYEGFFKVDAVSLSQTKGVFKMKIQTVFERTEKKYILTLAQRRELLKRIAEHIKPDEYGESTVCSLYFDTDDYRLIRRSMEKPVYKEKLRLRSYSTPKRDSNVFLELKKKYNGVVYKRRKTMKLGEAKDYLKYGVMPDDSQIMRELDWAMKYYKTIAPRVFIAYDRTAFYSRLRRAHTRPGALRNGDQGAVRNAALAYRGAGSNEDFPRHLLKIRNRISAHRRKKEKPSQRLQRRTSLCLIHSFYLYTPQPIR